MKNMKRFLAAAMAITSVMAIAPMSAFAENETGGTTNVKFNAVIEPAYTITIPASVDLNAETPTATIKAENVYLDTTKHKQINVTLDSAQYVNTGDSTFIAKTADGNSQVTYTIGKGEATTGVKVGDTVAEFKADGDQVLSFSEPTGATYAGTHTEMLTFGISVEDSFESVLAPALENGAKIKFEYQYNGRYSTYFEFTNNNGSYTLSPLAEDDDEFNTTNLSVKADNPNVLILDVVCAMGTRRLDSFCSTIEFDTTDNTFKFTNRGATSTNPPRKCDLISVSVNDTDVTNKLTDKSTDKS